MSHIKSLNRDSLACESSIIRGGHKPTKPDPPDKSDRLESLPARWRDLLRTDTGFILFFSRVSGGSQVLLF